MAKHSGKRWRKSETEHERMRGMRGDGRGKGGPSADLFRGLDGEKPRASEALGIKDRRVPMMTAWLWQAGTVLSASYSRSHLTFVTVLRNRYPKPHLRRMRFYKVTCPGSRS